jgi:hypothetical protein
MDSELIAVTARHVERLLIVLAGAASIYLGYRMFLAIPRAKTVAETGEGKLELPGGVSIYVTRVGPGVFFALFGAVILGFGLYQGLRLEVKEQRTTAATGDGTSSAPVATIVTERRLSSAVPSGVSSQVQETERTGTLGTVALLGRLAVALDGPGGRGLPPQQRNDFAGALTDARLRLLASVWDEPAWGPYSAFVRWVQEGESSAAPARAAPAVRAFRPDR